MATYLVKLGGRLIANVYYGPNETPKEGDMLRLNVAAPAVDPFNPPDAPKDLPDELGDISGPGVFKITSVGYAASGMPDGGNEQEPTIFVERVQVTTAR